MRLRRKRSKQRQDRQQAKDAGVTETGARFYIRSAAMADVRDLLRLKNNIWRQLYAGVQTAEFFDRMDAALPDTVAYWQDRVRRGAEMFVAEDLNGKVVGLAHGSKPTEQTLEVAPEARLEVRMVYVDPSARRYRLGLNLLKAAMGTTQMQQSKQQAKKHDDEASDTETVQNLEAPGAVVAWVWDGNAEAQAFFQAQGFEPVATRSAQEPWEGLTEVLWVHRG